MVIKETEPWLLWPDTTSFGINTGKISEVFEGVSDFTLAMRLKILSNEPIKRTVFAKLPNYCGIDVESNNTPLLILKLFKENEELSRYISCNYEIDTEFNWLVYRYSISKRIVEVLVNDIIVIEYKLEDDEELTSGVEPHIIFGAGNFPKNGFNLNYCSYDFDFLMISKSYKQFQEIIKIKNERLLDESIVGLYDFERHTDYKVYDLSENCNFIHKII